jgi:hypothetical protein
MTSRWLATAALLAACAAGRFHDELDLDGFRIREGMPSADLTAAVGPPDFVSGTGHRFAYEFRREGRTIDPAWEEWVWFRERNTHVVYVSGGRVERVGVIRDSPRLPDNGFGTFICGR